MQALLSLQSSGVPETQLPLAHFWMPLHTLVPPQPCPSVTGLWTQPLVGLHRSVVQGLRSSQSSGSLTHTPEAQCSLIVHCVLSAQSASLLQQPDVPWCLQPAWASQVSVVQELPSSQLGGVPGWQLPL